MATALLSPKSSVAAARFEPSLARDAKLGRWSCLVVSPTSEHQSQFSQAAAARGWATFATSDPHEALKFMCRNSIKLAVLDFQDVSQLTSSAQLENYRSLAEYIRWVGGVLMIVNGPENDSQFQDTSTELWARQLGSWSYVPGVLPQSDLSDMCEQAHERKKKRKV